LSTTEVDDQNGSCATDGTPTTEVNDAIAMDAYMMQSHDCWNAAIQQWYLNSNH